MLVEPSQNLEGLKHFNDPYWDPLWATCQDLNVPIHWHAGGGLRLTMPRWSGYTPQSGTGHGASGGLLGAGAVHPQSHLFWRAGSLSTPEVGLCRDRPGLGELHSGRLDHEWERRHLWTEGIVTRPSELFRRQIYVDFWYESAGIQQRHTIGIENIMWESDYPAFHVDLSRVLAVRRSARWLACREEERKQLRYGNAMRVYGL